MLAPCVFAAIPAEALLFLLFRCVSSFVARVVLGSGVLWVGTVSVVSPVVGVRCCRACAVCVSLVLLSVLA